MDFFINTILHNEGFNDEQIAQISEAWPEIQNLLKTGKDLIPVGKELLPLLKQLTPLLIQAAPIVQQALPILTKGLPILQKSYPSLTIAMKELETVWPIAVMVATVLAQRMKAYGNPVA